MKSPSEAPFEDSEGSAIPDLMITQGHELKAAREQLGWSCWEMGLALGLAGDRVIVRKRVEEMEKDQRQITGPMSAAVEAFLDGFRPAHFNPDTE